MSEIWTIKRFLDWCQEYLAQRGDKSPLRSARDLVSQVTSLSHVELYMNYERELTDGELDCLRPMVKRRGDGEPLQYILGTAPFRYLDIKVRPGVLIPRPETEVLVSEVLAALPAATRRVATDSLMNEYDGAAILEERRAVAEAGASADSAQMRAGRNSGMQGSSGSVSSAASALIAPDEVAVGDDGIGDEEFAADEQVEQPGDAVVFGARLAEDLAESDGPQNDGQDKGTGASAALSAEAAAKAEPFEGLLIADICTGSGCIACSLATERDDVRVVATDLAPEAVSLARENVQACGASARVGVLAGNLGEPIEVARPQFMGAFDAVVSNPPYVPSAVVRTLPSEVADYEPALALDGGEDGLDLFRLLLPWSQRALKPGGVFACELHETCLDAAAELARESGMADVRIVRDLTDRPRVLICRNGKFGA